MAEVRFVRIGFGNLLQADRILAVVAPDSAPVRRMIQEAKDRGSLIDASAGRKTRSVFVMDSDHIVLSAMEMDKVEENFSRKE